MYFARAMFKLAQPVRSAEIASWNLASSRMLTRKWFRPWILTPLTVGPVTQTRATQSILLVRPGADDRVFRSQPPRWRDSASSTV